MKLWQTNPSLLDSIEAFTVGRDRELDLWLAPFDVLGSLAHIAMLKEVGLLKVEEFEELRTALLDLYQDAAKGDFTIEPGIEDVHSQVELLLTRKLGDIGKKIHTGRSRNDQVLVDLRLFFRSEIQKISMEVQDTFNALIQLSEKYKDYLIPGYTHLQVGMVSSVGLWLSAYAESFTDDLLLLQSVYQINNQNPLGSAAGYGSSFPLNRKITTELLGFRDLNYNSIHAQLGRGKTELYLAFGLAGIAHTLGKMAMDICLFSNQNYAFLKLPEEITTGSSIMPHKKNPDVFELIRGRCNQLMTLPQQITSATNNLPSGYHRDFQLLKEIVFPALETIKQCLGITTFALPKIEFEKDVLKDPTYQYVFSVEAVNAKVKEGIPFRDAYLEVAHSINNGSFTVPEKLDYTHEGSVGNLCLEEIVQKKNVVLQGFGFEAIHVKEKALLSRF